MNMQLFSRTYCYFQENTVIFTKIQIMFTKTRLFSQKYCYFHEDTAIFTKEQLFSEKGRNFYEKQTKGVHQEGGEFVYFQFWNSCFCSSLGGFGSSPLRGQIAPVPFASLLAGQLASLFALRDVHSSAHCPAGFAAAACSSPHTQVRG